MLKLSKIDFAIFLASFYVFFSFAANIAATKVINVGPFVMDAGFIYAFIFTWRDLMHKQLGGRTAMRIVTWSVLINLLAAIYFQFVVLIPPNTDWANFGGQQAWEILFQLQPRIVLGSIIAQYVAELVDTKTYTWWTNRFGKNKPQGLRVIVSNAISIPIDSLLFCTIAFYGAISPIDLTNMILTNIVVKIIIAGVFFWTIKYIPEEPLYHQEKTNSFATEPC